MRVIPISDQAIQEAAGVLRAGGLVVYPTETSYGLAADPYTIEAVQKIFSVKGRNDGKPLGLIAANRQQVEHVVTILPEAEPLLQYWPGPLSLVLPMKVPDSEEHREGLKLTAAFGDTLSVRISSHPWARALAEAVGHPIIATSANRSSLGEVFDLGSINTMYEGLMKPDLAIDAGVLQEQKPSTVVIFQNGKPVVVRQGAVEIK